MNFLGWADIHSGQRIEGWKPIRLWEVTSKPQTEWDSSQEGREGGIYIRKDKVLLERNDGRQESVTKKIK